MLTGITTRTSTPQEDAEPWPGGSARPVLDYLTGTLGMTGAGARELLKAARTAQAETGPGTLADYPVPGGDAHLLIHYAPGSRAYRFKLTAPEPDLRPGTCARPRTGRRAAGKRRTAARPATPAARPSPGCQARRAGRQSRGRRRSRSLSGTTSPTTRRAGTPRCWTATSPATPWSPSSPTRPTPPGGRRRQIADEAFDIFNDHPRDPDGADLACAYYGRRLRSLSVGDIVCVGEVALAVGRPAGWEPASGPLAEVRTREHGTSPLPLPGRSPGSGRAPDPRKENHGE